MDFKDRQKRPRLSIEGNKSIENFLNINKAEEKEVYLLDVLGRGGGKRKLQIKSTVTSCCILASYMKCPKIPQCLVFKKNPGTRVRLSSVGTWQVALTVLQGHSLGAT